MDRNFVSNLLGLDERSRQHAISHQEREEFLGDPEIRQALAEWSIGIKSDAGLIERLNFLRDTAKTRVRLAIHWDENHSDETYERD